MSFLDRLMGKGKTPMDSEPRRDKKEVSRRDFLKGVVAGVVLAAVQPKDALGILRNPHRTQSTEIPAAMPSNQEIIQQLTFEEDPPKFETMSEELVRRIETTIRDFHFPDYSRYDDAEYNDGQLQMVRELIELVMDIPSITHPIDPAEIPETNRDPRFIAVVGDSVVNSHSLTRLCRWSEQYNGYGDSEAYTAEEAADQNRGVFYHIKQQLDGSFPQDMVRWADYATAEDINDPDYRYDHLKVPKYVSNGRLPSNFFDPMFGPTVEELVNEPYPIKYVFLSFSGAIGAAAFNQSSARIGRGEMPLTDKEIRDLVEGQIVRYTQVVRTLQEAGIEPVVTLAPHSHPDDLDIDFMQYLMPRSDFASDADYEEGSFLE